MKSQVQRGYNNRSTHKLSSMNLLRWTIYCYCIISDTSLSLLCLIKLSTAYLSLTKLLLEKVYMSHIPTYLKNNSLYSTCNCFCYFCFRKGKNLFTCLLNFFKQNGTYSKNNSLCSMSTVSVISVLEKVIYLLVCWLFKQSGSKVINNMKSSNYQSLSRQQNILFNFFKQMCITVKVGHSL